MKNQFFTTIGVAMSASFVGCGTAETSTSATRTDLTTTNVAARSRESGLALFRSLAGAHANRNLVVSPSSAIAAFSLLYPGASGTTRASLASTFGFSARLDTFYAERSALQARLLQRPTGLFGDSTYELTMANDVWAARDVQLHHNYLAGLRAAFGPVVHRVDFRSSPEGARAAINARIAGQTRNRIQDLLPQGTVASNTRLVLTNAAYFLADWLEPFDRADVRKGTFRADDGTTREVDMMTRTGSYRVAKTADFTLVSLPYVGEKMEMVFLLPNRGTLAALERRLDARTLALAHASMRPAMIELTVPKFTIAPSTAVSLREPLERLGLRSVFCDQPGVNLTGIAAGEDLCVSAAVQKAFIKVDEKGTEAAAATGVVVVPTSMLLPQGRVRIDHSALFAIMEKNSREVLFVGRLWMP